MRALVALMLVACGGTLPSSSTLKGTSEPPRHATPTSPAPSINFVDDRFEMSGFPAVTRDRGYVVLPVIESDGGRGYPNLRIEIRTASDKTIETLPVMISNDYEALVPNGEAGKELVRRIEKVNARLRELHARDDLVTMQKAEKLENEFVIHDTYEVKYEHDSIKLIFDADHSFSFQHLSWKAPKGATMPGSPPCENPEHLEQVYYARDINAIVIELAYQGTDLCWEPANSLHVLTW